MVTTTTSPTAAGNRRTSRMFVHTAPTPTEAAKQYLVEAAKHHTEAKRSNPYHRPSVNVEIKVCYSAGYAATWVSRAPSAANERKIASALSRREASGGRTMLPIQTDWQANQRGAAVPPVLRLRRLPVPLCRSSIITAASNCCSFWSG